MSDTETIEVQEPVAEVQQEQVIEQPVQAAPKKEVDSNWARANEVLKLQKQRIEELEARIAQQTPKLEPEVDEFANLDPDEPLTVKQFREMHKKSVTKEAEAAAKKLVQEYAHQQKVVDTERDMRDKHEDYDYIIENFVVPLIKSDPALAYQINNSPNPAKTAYKLGKLSDAYEEANMTKATSPKAEKILKNVSRPVSSAAVGPPLKSQAEDFSKMSQAQVWEMSQKYARQA